MFHLFPCVCHWPEMCFFQRFDELYDSIEVTAALLATRWKLRSLNLVEGEDYRAEWDATNEEGARWDPNQLTESLENRSWRNPQGHLFVVYYLVHEYGHFVEHFVLLRNNFHRGRVVERRNHISNEDTTLTEKEVELLQKVFSEVFIVWWVWVQHIRRPICKVLENNRDLKGILCMGPWEDSYFNKKYIQIHIG